MNAADPEARALLTLMLTPGLGQTLVGRCLDAFGSAQHTLDASADALGRIKGISAQRAGELKRRLDDIGRDGTVDRELNTADQAGVQLVHRDEPGYPRLLRLIPDAPLMLWVRGELNDEDALALAVVGSRRCSQYGREQADRLAGRCAEAGLCIVSGGAYGIDIVAHRAAIRHGGRTVAVVGSGLAKPYPQDHAGVFEQIVSERRGAIVSELPMSAGPRPENFPRRNRIISGMALGVLVVEAAKRSGALITARLCVEDHGRECMAVPGRVDTPHAAGCHHILREGWASLVTNPQEVLDQLGEAGQLLKAGLPESKDQSHAAPASDSSSGTDSLFEQSLTALQRELVQQMQSPVSLDELVSKTGLAAAQVQAELTVLEVRGTVQRKAGRFVRRSAAG